MMIVAMREGSEVEAETLARLTFRECAKLRLLDVKIR